MRRLFPPAAPPAPTEAPVPPAPTDAEGPEPTLAELAAAYAYPRPVAADGCWLRANMVASLDGAAHHEHRSQPLSGPADMRIFGVLRALADAVVVGAETVRREGYRPARARAEFAADRAAAGQSPAAAIVVVSASLDLDFAAPLFAAPVVPSLVVTGAGAPPDRLAAAAAAGVEVLLAGDGATAEPHRIRAALAARGLTRLLTEGGPRLLGAFAGARALDELCLTVAPRLALGAASRVVAGPEVPVPHEFRLTDLLTDEGFLFHRYRAVGAPAR
ncbi:dihydrofolate reductase family protein [Streptomyces sp. DSM 44915]|uniref:Dihydrofolate reductase family protein n=1 Tax=Streptomyces chisholmiae TaxID=3075540 RepID=A0ABU2JMT5_9ACTN|nr:dihydrofolate reductase family protein [Streptomyces sp. DSM 44915]MDT0266297.1 dihydrofolate reductase family protein [Streptomyces sp. DSM 44915]